MSIYINIGRNEVENDEKFKIYEDRNLRNQRSKRTEAWISNDELPFEQMIVVCLWNRNAKPGKYNWIRSWFATRFTTSVLYFATCNHTLEILTSQFDKVNNNIGHNSIAISKNRCIYKIHFKDEFVGITSNCVLLKSDPGLAIYVKQEIKLDYRIRCYIKQRENYGQRWANHRFATSLPYQREVWRDCKYNRHKPALQVE